MSKREFERLEVIQRVDDGLMTQTQAAAALGLQRRQVYRLLQTYRDNGPTGLASKRRGKRSNHQLADGLAAQALRLISDRYADFGPTLATEKLVELHGLAISVNTVRKLMIEAGLWLPRKARLKRAYQPRNRRECVGELIQIDGSEHRWFEDRAPPCSLLVYVDDATSRIMSARFVQAESTFEYGELTKQYLRQYGRPLAFYSDKLSVFRINRADALGGEGVTQFGRALSELGVELICANSSQAKGRVERANGVLQDRLVKELRLHAVTGMQAGNRFLPTFLADYNRRFGKPPRYAFDAHRPLATGSPLDDIFAWQEDRRVSHNLTLRYDKVLYCLDPRPENLALRGKPVRIYDYPDGRIRIWFQGREIAYVREFDKRSHITQADVVENKRLSAVLAMAKARQDLMPTKRGSKPVRHPAQLEN